MKYSLLSLLFTIVIAGCDESVKYLEPDNKPMWPQFGYDGRQSGNNSSNTYISPVMNGVLEWEFPNNNGPLGDGSEYCVDSKGNIYYQDDNSPGSLFKFAPDGRVIWKVDSLTSYNFSAISMNKEETRIYFYVDNPGGLYCFDSSGNKIWSKPWWSFNKVILDREGTVYTYTTSGFSAINPDGSIKWSNSNFPSSVFNSGVYNAMDRDGNIYLSGSKIVKLDKSGSMLWQFSLDTSNAFVDGITIDGYNNLYFTEWRKRVMYSLDKDGNLRWKLNGPIYIPAISSENILFVPINDSILAYDINGNKIWSSPVLETGFGGSYNIYLDSEDNLYYLVGTIPVKVVSRNKNGNHRWTYTSTAISSILPNAVLSPLGKLIHSPKRAYVINCIN